VALIQAGDHTVVDLRPPTAYAAGHVAGAVNIDASAPDFGDRVRGLDDSVPYLVYADSKKESAPAADKMVRVGIDRVVDAGAFGLLALAGAELD
jgi:rhodanese-related sulfurtransferase